MPLTRDFRKTVKERADRDSDFRLGLLQESLNSFLADDLETGKILLRDYVNATIGFETLGLQLHKSPKSLMRMLSGHGNPRAENLFAVLAHLQAREGLSFSVHPSEDPGQAR